MDRRARHIGHRAAVGARPNRRFARRDAGIEGMGTEHAESRKIGRQNGRSGAIWSTAAALPLKKTVTSVFKRARDMLSIAAAPRTFGVAAADGGPDAAVCVQVSAKFFTFVG